jgi:hypothetical protein
MNNTVLVNILRFLALLAAQALVFNNVSILGIAFCFPYILFIILYPVNGNGYLLLLLAFLLGICEDSLLNTGGPHAVACVVLAFMRPTLFKFSFGISYEYQTIKINERIDPDRLMFILLSVIIHHLILYLLEEFRFSLIPAALLRTLCTGIFTLLVCVITIYLIKPGKQQ